MTQTVPATCVLGPGLTGLTIGLRVLNLDGTTYAAFATTDVAETSVAGTYRKAGGVACPDAGAYIVWGTALVDYAEATVGSTSAQDIANALLLAPAGISASGSVMAYLAGIDADTGTAIPNILAGITALTGGIGTIAWPYTLLSDEDASPIPQARVEVWNSDDTLFIQQGYTDNNGLVTFYLDPGTYNIRRSKAGWGFANPDIETVEEP